MNSSPSLCSGQPVKMDLRMEERTGSFVVHSLMLAGPIDVAERWFDQQIQIFWKMLVSHGNWARQTTEDVRVAEAL